MKFHRVKKYMVRSVGDMSFKLSFDFKSFSVSNRQHNLFCVNFLKFFKLVYFAWIKYNYFKKFVVCWRTTNKNFVVRPSLSAWQTKTLLYFFLLTHDKVLFSWIYPPKSLIQLPLKNISLDLQIFSTLYIQHVILYSKHRYIYVFICYI
jgi:hypothetical protein